MRLDGLTETEAENEDPVWNQDPGRLKWVVGRIREDNHLVHHQERKLIGYQRVTRMYNVWHVARVDIKLWNVVSFPEYKEV